jgi:hypothetical protein
MRLASSSRAPANAHRALDLPWLLSNDAVGAAHLRHAY